MTRRRPTHFLNVDLEVRSRKNIEPLVAWMDREAVVLRSERHRGLHVASFELASARQSTPDRRIARLAALVEALPTAERSLWDGASVRTFDVGVQAGADGHVFVAPLASATLSRVAGLGASVVVTVYPYGWGEALTPRARRGG